MAVSKIRRLSGLAAKSSRTPADRDEFESLFKACLHEPEKKLYRAIMADLDLKVGAATELHRLDYALAVVNGLILCRLTDAGDHGEAQQVSVGWNRHARPLLADINAKLAKRAGKHGRGNVLDVFQDILSEDAETMPEAQEASTVDLI
jgi:hypothetical protein